MDRLNREILGASEGRTMKYTPKKDSWSPLIQTLQISSCLSGSLQPLLYYLYIFVLLVVFLLCFPLKCTHFCCRASLTWRRKSGSKAASTALAKTGPPCCASATDFSGSVAQLGNCALLTCAKTSNTSNRSNTSNMSHVMSHCSPMNMFLNIFQTSSNLCHVRSNQQDPLRQNSPEVWVSLRREFDSRKTV